MGKLYKYLPLLRTRAAELKAYKHLSDTVKDQIIPIFELTRARRSKYDGEGNIAKNIAAIKELVGNDRWFALDLTVTEQQSNRAIDAILEDGENGFEKWISLLHEFDDYKVIPAIHIDPAYKNLLAKQIGELRNISSCLLLRISVKEDQPVEMLEDIIVRIPKTNDIAVILDREYIDIRDDAARENDLKTFQQVCERFGKHLHSISYTSSSFPSSVVKPGYGRDGKGHFDLSETTFFNELIQVKEKAKTCYSDYATVHPLVYRGGGGGWVPRVDFPRATDLFYHRYRRDDGGYIRAASKVKNDKMYRDYGDWGCNEIELAAQGMPNGKSPAHWISVRMSLHMARQVERLQTNTHNGFEL